MKLEHTLKNPEKEKQTSENTPLRAARLVSVARRGHRHDGPPEAQRDGTEPVAFQA